MKTRISVIIPSYNVQEFLEECVDSVLDQTMNEYELTDGYERNLQIILIDDGSTDDTARIAKKYAEEFENVEYHYEVNQGLGHARNYGCEFAEGDYIIFLDSDDIVPRYAYELMYRAAVRNNSDMTIGAVWRYSSQGAWMSNIHQTAFNGTKEVTHITESPELFYDTTAWNKLIRRSFWEENGFQFPEGILYEDIPVTIPMHFLANNVSLVHENCYLWRVREGKSKSITQTTAEVKNMEDRLYVMGKVDEFFDENVDDPNLHHVKNMKWLKNDLMIFVHKLKSVDKEDANELMEGVRQYIKNNIDPSELKYLNEIEKLRYEYLMDDDFDKLVGVLNFENDTLKVTKVYQKGSHVMFDADKELFKKSPFYIDQYIRERPNLKYLQDLDFTDDAIIVQGFTVIPGLDIRNASDRTYSFNLINSETRARIPLEHEDVNEGDLSQFKIPFGIRSFSYDAASYKLTIPFELLYDKEEFMGMNRIMVSFKQEDIEYNFYAGSAKIDLRSKTKMLAKIYKDKYFRFIFTLKNEVIIEILPLENCYDKISIEDGDLCIHSPQDNGDMVVYYEADSLNEEYEIPFVYDNDKKCYKVGLDNLSGFKGKILYADDRDTVTFHEKGLIPFHSSQGQCIVDTMRHYFMSVYMYDDTVEVSNITRNNGKFEITANLYSVYGNVEDVKSIMIYFRDKLNYDKRIISEGKIQDNGDIKFTIDLSDINIRKDLYQGFHDVTVDYELDGEIHTTPLFILYDYEEHYTNGLFDYKVYPGQKGKLIIKSVKSWPKLEDSPGKRLRHSKFTYEAFRKLPINNKRILFESMWGTKYSCNPQFLYEYIDENYPDYECIWALNDEQFPIKGNGKRVRRGSIKYFYYLATSKFFVNNVNFHDHYVKRDGQIEIQTMHGTPLKTLGLDVPGDFPTKQSENLFLEKCDRWDYMTVQSDFVADIAERCFLFKKQFLKYGYPRTDMLYNKNNEENINAIKEKLGLPLDKKVILYAPTWRLKNKFDLMIDLESFRKSLSDEYVLILRLHHFSVPGWKQPPEDDFIYDFSKFGSIEELYLISDVLITDYSSVMFDYAILDRPIILFTYDLKEYGEKLRGFYIDIQENAPGPILFTSEEVEDAVVNLEKTEEDSKSLRKTFREKFLQYENGNSSKQIFEEVVLGNNKSSAVSKIISKILP